MCVTLIRDYIGEYAHIVIGGLISQVHSLMLSLRLLAASIAQLVENLPHEQYSVGSNPT